MKLKIKLEDFEQQIDNFVSEAKSIKATNPLQMSEEDFETVKNKIKEWKNSCFQFLQNAFETEQGKYSEYAIEFHNAGSGNHYQIAGGKKDFKRLQKEKLQDFDREIDTLEYIKRFVHISDAVVNPEIIKERTNFTAEQIVELLLDKLYHLYGNYEYRITDILKANGIMIKTYAEGVEYADILEEYGYVDRSNRSEIVRLNVKGKSYIEQKSKEQKNNNSRETKTTITNNKVFIVHGHNKEMELATEMFLKDIGLEPIILHKQANEGKTIIEKLETYTDVSFAVVLMSADDIAFTKSDKSENKKARARQNVIFEMGLFIGKLGRGKVAVLLEEIDNFEMFSDYYGVLYTPYNKDEIWKYKLAKELKAVGFKIDTEKIL